MGRGKRVGTWTDMYNKKRLFFFKIRIIKKKLPIAYKCEVTNTDEATEPSEVN